ncbi:ATP-dependent DNA helicase chl1 [Coemansia biformis]|uniref:ATP-dependent DNA helicase CHL1 n=1 Tax=Coemansia biformis TaxID=1286918 RepID=A0A9W7YE67_9FUNG|nr:ATP-dependent DNA helicase chl1 [Coemansia biformis]
MTPYSIQLEFMQRLFDALEDGEFGIFESPTGTGKSLSIICGALTWIQHNERRRQQHAVAKSGSEVAEVDTRPDWVREYERKRVASGQTSGEGREQERYQRWVAAVRRREAAQRKGQQRQGQLQQGHPRLGKRTVTSASGDAADSDGSDDDAVVDAYHSGGEQGGAKNDDPVEYSDAVRRLLERKADNKLLCDSDDSCSNSSDDGVPEEPIACKVFYASRTHSQLQQFVNEVKRTKFAQDKIRCVTLGSRWQLCVNDRVRAAGSSVHALNERCLEMQQSAKKARCACLPVQATPMLDFKDAMAQKIMDIEELAAEGRRRGVCAYYGSREAVRAAQVVALPYNMLLSQSARESMGISLAGNIVIVDEAHNLVDTILATHSVTLGWRTVKVLLDMVQLYFKKYWQRLRGSNVVYIRQTIALLRALNKYLQRVADENRDSHSQSTAVISVNEFLQRANVDHINVYKIDRYLRESKLGRKLNMFAERRQEHHISAGSNSVKRVRQDAHVIRHADASISPSPAAPAPASAVAALEAFMECIGNPDRTGARLVVRTAPPADDGVDVELKYLLLDPSEAFGEIRKEARAVVLAGGTMRPVDDMIKQLLPRFGRLSLSDCTNEQRLQLDPDRVRQFAWGHVVPRTHICALVVDRGPTGEPLRFAYQDQSNATRIREAGQALAALCNVIPGGVAVFFPSYALLGKMMTEWHAAGVAQRIAKRKPVFSESADEGVLARYTEQVRRPGSSGAVLLSVVGGRLSEGINFSDDLGRAVVMIGVPYPSLTSPELKERLDYYESIGDAPDCARRPATSGQMGPRARELYDALCMRAVNQSIGRAIRHRADYAAIVFLDARYAEPRIASRLPGWIAGEHAGRSVPSCAFGPALAQVSAFFKSTFAL